MAKVFSKFAFMSLFILVTSPGAWAARVDLVTQEKDISVGDRIEFKVREINGEIVNITPGSKHGDYLIEEIVKEADGVLIRAVPVKSGPAAFAPLEIKSEGQTETQKTDAISTEIKSVLKDEKEQPVDIRPPRSVGVPLWWWLVWVGLPLLLLAGILIWLIRRLRARKPGERATLDIPQTPKTPFELAMERIRKIEAQAPWKDRKFKLLYFELTDILKEYCENEFGDSLRESTTTEFRQKMPQKTGAGWDDILTRCFDLMMECDVVKFTDVTPELTRAENIHRDFESVIVKIKERRTPPHADAKP